MQIFFFFKERSAIEERLQIASRLKYVGYSFNHEPRGFIQIRKMTKKKRKENKKEERCNTEHGDMKPSPWFDDS